MLLNTFSSTYSYVYNCSSLQICVEEKMRASAVFLCALLAFVTVASQELAGVSSTYIVYGQSYSVCKKHMYCTLEIKQNWLYNLMLRICLLHFDMLLCFCNLIPMTPVGVAGPQT